MTHSVRRYKRELAARNKSSHWKRDRVSSNATGTPRTDDGAQDSARDSARPGKPTSGPGITEPHKYADAAKIIRELRERQPWDGPPEFLSALSETPNPNPLPPYRRTASSMVPKHKVLGQPAPRLKRGQEMPMVPWLEKDKFPEVYLMCELAPVVPCPRDMHARGSVCLTDILMASAGNVFSCRQVERLIRLLPRGIPGIRVEALVTLYGKIADLRNVARVLFALTMPERKAVMHRIGILNLWDPMAPDGYYALEMNIPEMRKITEFLVRLAIVEPGENWCVVQVCCRWLWWR